MALNVHETHTMEDRRLPFIFHTDTVERIKERGSNWHENIELLCFIEGEGRLHIDERHIAVKAGDVAVINADELHSVVSESCAVYHCLIIDNEFCTENGIDVRRLNFSAVVTDGPLFSEFTRLALEITDPNKPHAIPSIRHGVLGILLNICKNHSTEKSSTGRDVSYAQIKEIVRYLRENFRDITLDKIADHVNMSKFYMSREFKRVMGLTVFEYLNVLKCENARRMLWDGAKVSEAATYSGFENLSYFSRTFKRYMGILPSECKRRG